MNSFWILAGLPRARLMEYGQLLFVWLSRDWPSIHVYRLYGWGRGDYQMEGRGVSGMSWQPHIFYIGHSLFTIWSIDSCQNRIVMCQLIEVMWFIWKLSADQLNVLLDHDQCSISYFLASLGAQLIMHTYWTSDINVVINWQLSKQGIRWPVSLERIAGSGVDPSKSSIFFKLSADKLLVFKWSQAQV